jgi:hypothetical protein
MNGSDNDIGKGSEKVPSPVRVHHGGTEQAMDEHGQMDLVRERFVFAGIMMVGIFQQIG